MTFGAVLVKELSTGTRSFRIALKWVFLLSRSCGSYRHYGIRSLIPEPRGVVILRHGPEACTGRHPNANSENDYKMK